MSETIRGTCGHNWLDFAVYATGNLNENEERVVEALVAACDVCANQLDDHIWISALLKEAAAARRIQQRTCWNSWPPRGRR